MLFSANKYIYYLPETDKKLLAPPPHPPPKKKTPTQKEEEETQVKLSTIISNTNTSDEGLYQTTNGKRSYNRFFAIFFFKKNMVELIDSKVSKWSEIFCGIICSLQCLVWFQKAYKSGLWCSQPHPQCQVVNIWRCPVAKRSSRDTSHTLNNSNRPCLPLSHNFND